MAAASDIMALVLSVPAVPFARLTAEGSELRLSYEGRPMASVEITATDRPTAWSATQVINELAYQALFRSGIHALPPGEAVNAAHQLVEWWDAGICAIGRATSP